MNLRDKDKILRQIEQEFTTKFKALKSHIEWFHNNNLICRHDAEKLEDSLIDTKINFHNLLWGDEIDLEDYLNARKNTK